MTRVETPQSDSKVGSPSFHLKNILSLTLITTITTFALLYIYYATYVPPNPMQDVQNMLGKAAANYQIESKSFPAGSPVENPLSQNYWIVRDGETELMRVFKVNAGGFGGAVVTIVGVDGENVRAISVLDASGETAGLGQRITEQKFQRQFIGRARIEIPANRTEWGPNKLDMVSSATFSSSAVARNITQAFNLYRISQAGEQ